MSLKPFIDVHLFDGQLKNKYVSIKNFSIEEKNNMFNNFKNELKCKYAIYMVDIIISDLKECKGANYQIENDIDCSDILADIIIYKDFKDILPLLEEQLEDIFKLGRCNSGRVTRFFQIWKSIYEK